PPAAGARPRRARRAFAGAFAVVVAVLAVVGATGAALGTAQGPHVTGVEVDPAAAAAASGSRLVVTTSQSLQDVDPSQVTVEPAVPFAVDTSGRAVGVRFALPLFDDTEYTVTFRDVQGLGGGPTATFAESFRTPRAEVFLLQRGDDGDAIFRTDLTGANAVKVFEHEHIEDFRATSSRLVVSVRDDDGAQLITTDLDGGDARTLPLPGEGYVSNLQSADRGDRIGYTFSDADLGGDGGLESALFTTSLRDPAGQPTRVEIAGADPRVAQWRFVPDTDSILLLSFDGSVLLTDAAATSATALGSAVSLDGIAGTHAIVERIDGVEVVDLSDGSTRPLIGTEEEGIVGAILPVAGGGTLRTVTPLDEQGLPTASRIVFVTDDGTESTLYDVDPADAVVQTCVAPSGRYAAVTIAPDVVRNPYDMYQLPLPGTLETHVVEISSATEVVALAGSAPSWCRVPPQ
ncbi:hypothetical protein, partial [Microbacterium ulmi]